MKTLLRLSVVLALAVACAVHGPLRAGDKKEEKKDGTKEEKKENKDTVVNGELTNADLKDKVRTDMFCKTYTFKMTEGRTYQIDLKGANQLDTYLRLENPGGEQVAEDDDGGGFPDARIVYRAPKSGDYTIICTTFAPGATGKFTLTIKDLNGRQPDPIPKNQILPVPPPPPLPPRRGGLESSIQQDVRIDAAITDAR